jgi:hypothetical protein
LAAGRTVRYVRAAVNEVVGLFVSDWTQALITVVILGLGWLAIARLHLVVLAFALAVALAAQLIFSTGAEARRTRSQHQG